MKGDVKRRNNGVKVTMGTVTDRSDVLMAFMYNMVVTIFSVPPTRSAGQNRFPNSISFVKTNNGSIKGKAKIRSDHATIYSLHFSRLFLPRTSFKDSKSAVKNE
jgi:hypothetical protein